MTGVFSALESSHAIWEGVRRAKEMSKDQNIVIVCGLTCIPGISSFTIHSSVYLAAATKTSNRYLSSSPGSGKISWIGTLPDCILEYFVALYMAN